MLPSHLLVFFASTTAAMSSTENSLNNNDQDTPEVVLANQNPSSLSSQVSSRIETQMQTRQDPSFFPPPSPRSDDDELMVYETPNDYATWARGEKAGMLSRGEEAILQSEVSGLVSRREDEPVADFAKRWSDMHNDLIHRGVSILNDQCTADVVASGFGMEGGRTFDLGPGKGVTKGEFRDFGRWWDERVWVESGEGEVVVPERFLRWEVEPEAFEEREQGAVEVTAERDAE